MGEDDRRMIEHEIPLDVVNYHSAKEKKHPRRFVELIHLWPARRPRSASRVAIAAALMKVPKTATEIKERLDLLAELAPYECNQSALQKARTIIRAEHGGRAPKVLDLFAGGGAIPLEAANLGCEAYAVELNPVAHIIELATCVYPQRYGAKLADLVETWGKWVLDRVQREIGDLYPQIHIENNAQAKQLAFAMDGGGAGSKTCVDPIAYLWTRTVPCIDRDCGATVPLVRQTWLCRKDGRAIALRLATDKKTKRVRFEIVSATSAERLGFDPADHSDGGEAECPFCGATIDVDKVKALGMRGKIGTQLMAIAGTVDGERGRVYLPADAVAMPSDATLRSRLSAFGDEWPGPAKVVLPPNDGGGSCAPYGLDEFWKLFSDRQATALLTFSRAIRDVLGQMLTEGIDAELGKAAVTYLALALDKAADGGNTLARWQPSDQIVIPALSRYAFPIVWDFAEVNPFASVLGGMPLAIAGQAFAIRGLATVPSSVVAIRGSAADLPMAAETFDAVITDPPYYDKISYADLSDFFYVWLKRTAGDLYQGHLDAAQTPKKQEATVVPHRHGGDEEKARAHYEHMMTDALHEASRVVKRGAPVVVVYAHKTVAGWAALVDSLRRSECMILEAWPLRTEANQRLSAQNATALATSIFLAARKRRDDAVCNDYDDVVLPEVARVIDERARTLWKHGLTGADLVIAIIGAALGPFTRYAEVRRANGAPVTTAEFLEEAQRGALEAILKQVVRDTTGKDVSVSAIDPVSRLYVVARLQFGDAAADYDVFKNLAIGALPSGTELDGMKGALMQGKRALLAKKGSKVTLRAFDERGSERDLGLPDDGVVSPLVDVLHRLLWLQNHRPSEVGQFLGACGADLGAVRLLAQALGGRPLRAEPQPGAQKDMRNAEQRAIDTLLASFQDVTRAASTGALFDQAASKRARRASDGDPA